MFDRYAFELEYK